MIMSRMVFICHVDLWISRPFSYFATKMTAKGVIMISRIAVGAVGIVGSCASMVVVAVMAHSWPAVLCCLIFIGAMVQEWRRLVRAEADRPARGARPDWTVWWNLVGYYLPIITVLSVILGQEVWHFSDLAMVVGVSPLVVLLFVWAVVRAVTTPKPLEALPRRMIQ